MCVLLTFCRFSCIEDAEGIVDNLKQALEVCVCVYMYVYVCACVCVCVCDVCVCAF